MGDQVTPSGESDDREARFSRVYESTRAEILAYLLGVPIAAITLEGALTALTWTPAPL